MKQQPFSIYCEKFPLGLRAIGAINEFAEKTPHFLLPVD